MQNMKKKGNTHCNAKSGEPLQQKERHIVTWSQEEDDILREQIRIHGTDNWAIIASKFKDKTTRQCRRRWFTYLNSDFKKGGWSPEEDMLLCEAQRIFGNRWTEIAKVVSGRTDNAVKNRFSTLCKKRAKNEALLKENDTPYINQNNKRLVFQNGQTVDGILETLVPPKKIRRKHIPDIIEDCNRGEASLGDCRTNEQQLRTPFAVLVQNFRNMNDLPNQLHANDDVPNDASCNMIQGTFLKKDDPKIIALMQQAELLSSLALKVNTENTDQSLENAWKVVQDFINHTKESDMLKFKISDMDFHLENFKDLVEDIRSGNKGRQQSWRQPDLYEESPDSSEYSTGSTVVSQTSEIMEQTQTGLSEGELQPAHTEDPNGLVNSENIILSGGTTNDDLRFPEDVDIVIAADSIPSCDELKNELGAVCVVPSTEFDSPLQVTPLFRSLAAGIPSPQFSESERHFLLKTLGMESTSPKPSIKPSQHPPCKRALLHCL